MNEEKWRKKRNDFWYHDNLNVYKIRIPRCLEIRREIMCVYGHLYQAMKANWTYNYEPKMKVWRKK